MFIYPLQQSHIEYKIFDRISIYGSTRYDSRSVSVRTKYDEAIQVDCGMSLYAMRNKNLVISLDFTDVFNTKKTKSEYLYDNTIKYRHVLNNAQSVSLTLSFKLNDGKDIENEAREQVNNTSRFSK